jgi:hypothetical protein
MGSFCENFALGAPDAAPLSHRQPDTNSARGIGVNEVNAGALEGLLDA